MSVRSLSRAAPSGLTAAFVVALAVAIANFATGVYGGAIVAGIGALVVGLLATLS